MNSVILYGRLSQDPETRQTQTGKLVCRFTVAVNRRGQEGADFISCIAWEKLANTITKYCTKGKPVIVEGRLAVRKYQDSSGNNRTATEVVCQNIEFVGSNNANGNQDGYAAPSHSTPLPPLEYEPDEVPF